MAKLKLSPPWVAYYKKLNALFDKDKTISVYFDEDEMEIKICSQLEDKSKALSLLLPQSISFGGAELTITVIPANQKKDKDVYNTIKEIREDYNNILTSQAAIIVLFNNDGYVGNGHVDKIKDIDTPYGEFVYVIFKKEVIQYYEDNISDFYGNRSTLCEDIAKEIFNNIEGVFFCTSNE